MNSEKRLHIVSFDNPYPPDYGGVIDVFYKIKELHKAGVKVILHAFVYGRSVDPELNKYCEKIYYYKRKQFINPLSRLPYIVASRRNEQLIYRLVTDEAPILFEGLHTCYYLHHPKLKNRMKVVRMHNIEHDYYENLKEVESSRLKKLFFHHEANRLRNFESVLQYADKIIAISNNDATYLKTKFKHVSHVTAFHPNETITAKTGKGEYALYHGKLSVGENDEAARFLAEKVFNQTDIPLYIAGNDPSNELRTLVTKSPNISLMDNLNTEQISNLIANAHVNVLPTFQATGIKLKLINVLYQGRFVMANSTMVSNTGCEQLCIVANSADSFLEHLKQIFSQPFTQADLDKRNGVLNGLFDNEANANRLIEEIFTPI